MSIFASFDDARRDAASLGDDPAGRVTIKPAPDLTAEDHARWASLWARCCHRNIFASDWFMASALNHCAAPRGVSLAAVHDGSGAWLGVLPLVFEGMMGRWPLPALCNWRCDLQYDASPLVEPGAEHLFWHTLLTHLDRQRGSAIALRLEGLPLDDPATRALIEVCLVGERRLEQTGRFSRPMLAHFGSCDAAPESVSPARRTLDQWLDRCLRELEAQVGKTKFANLSPGADPADWIDHFLALEKTGRQGSAPHNTQDSDQDKAALFADVITAAAKRRQVRLTSLEGGGRPIAMCAWLLQEGCGYGFRRVEDQAYQSFEPGRLLMRAILDEVARGPSVMFDSGALHDTASDPLWPQARDVADYIMPIGGRAQRRIFSAAICARTALAHLTSLIHDGAVAGYSAPALLQWA